MALKLVCLFTHYIFTDDNSYMGSLYIWVWSLCKLKTNFKRKLWTKVVNKSCEQGFLVFNKSCKHKLGTKFLESWKLKAKSKYWTKGVKKELWKRVESKSCEQKNDDK